MPVSRISTIASAAAVQLLVAAVAASTATPGSARRVPVYPTHTNITATVFWVGEPVGNGSSEDNALSAWDDLWQAHYGGYDDYSYVRSAPYFPRFRPRENPFYLDLPYNDFNDDGTPRSDRLHVVPWARAYAGVVARAATAGKPYSLMKNRWVRMWRTVAGVTHTCYGQIEDSGPYVYDDAAYVFGANDARPASRQANNAGMDVSPAIRDCLHFSGLNNADNRLNWRFVERSQVPRGPWTRVPTSRGVFWR